MNILKKRPVMARCVRILSMPVLMRLIVPMTMPPLNVIAYCQKRNILMEPTEVNFCIWQP